MNLLAEFFGKHGPEMLFRLYEHVYLTVIAMVVATIIAVPLGIYLAKTRWPWLSSVIIGFASIIQTIPSLALLALIVAVFALISLVAKTLALPSIGVVPAVIALVLYALLPMLRNTYTAIKQVDPSIVEVARGMGMRPSQVLLQVELPLALPVIMAGLRISTVWTIGIATLCSLVGAGGLGDPIIKGLRSYQIDYIFAGSIPAAALALVLDWLLSRLEHWLTPEGLRLEGKGGTQGV